MLNRENVQSNKMYDSPNTVPINKEKLLEDIIIQYGKQLMNFIFTYVKDWGIAEEITQDVFIKAYQRIETFQHKSSLKTWLLAIAANKSKDHLRKKYLRKMVLMDNVLNHATSEMTPEIKLIQTTEEQALAQLVLQLPIKYREVVILYYYEDLTLKEISQLLKQKLPTCKSRLQRGRAMLKKNLEKEDAR